jgi:hypothetical protein
VAQHVGERLLDDAIGDQVDRAGKAVPLAGDEQLDRQAAVGHVGGQ